MNPLQQLDTVQHLIQFLGRREIVRLSITCKELRNLCGYFMLLGKCLTPLIKSINPMLAYFHLSARTNTEKYRTILLLFLKSARKEMFIGCKNSYYRRFVHKYAQSLGFKTEKHLLDSNLELFCPRDRCNVKHPRHYDCITQHKYVQKSGVMVYKV